MVTSRVTWSRFTEILVRLHFYGRLRLTAILITLSCCLSRDFPARHRPVIGAVLQRPEFGDALSTCDRTRRAGGSSPSLLEILGVFTSFGFGNYREIDRGSFPVSGLGATSNFSLNLTPFELLMIVVRPLLNCSVLFYLPLLYVIYCSVNIW